MAKCHCGELAEIKWKVSGEENRRQEHMVCSNCMSVIWETINNNYSHSNAQQVSTFEFI